MQAKALKTVNKITRVLKNVCMCMCVCVLCMYVEAKRVCVCVCVLCMYVEARFGIWYLSLLFCILRFQTETLTELRVLIGSVRLAGY